MAEANPEDESLRWLSTEERLKLLETELGKLKEFREFFLARRNELVKTGEDHRIEIPGMGGVSVNPVKMTVFFPPGTLMNETNFRLLAATIEFLTPDDWIDDDDDDGVIGIDPEKLK